MEQPVFGNSRSQIWLQHWFVLTVRAVEHCAFLFLFLWPHAVVNSQWQKYDVAFMWHHAMILRLSFRVVGKKKKKKIKDFAGTWTWVSCSQMFFSDPWQNHFVWLSKDILTQSLIGFWWHMQIFNNIMYRSLYDNRWRVERVSYI